MRSPQEMRSGGFRRIPVTASDDSLVGLVSLDDILGLLAEEFTQVGALVEKEMLRSTVAACHGARPAD